MMMFKYAQDVEEWLEDKDYEQFWEEIQHQYISNIIPRDRCDQDIMNGACEDLVLNGLKTMVRVELTTRYRLEEKETVPKGSTVH